jgi:type II secretory pathway pseudopilin PulG
MSEMLPQPPPNVPAPPPSEAALSSQKRWNSLVSLGVFSIVVLLLLALTAPLTIRAHKKADLTEAISNARQIGLALYEFEQAYGRFPDESTIPQVKEIDPANTSPLGKSSSNDFFRQLIAAEIVQSEFWFYSNASGSRKPDNVINGAKALEKRECAFAYVSGLTTAGNPAGTPIVLFPMVPGKLLFDYKLCKKHYNGSAVILRLDNSVTSYPVDKSGRVWIDGKDLFDPTQPFWNGKVPDVKWPE